MKRTFKFAAVVGVVLAAMPAGLGSGAPSRIVDRTLVCTPFALYGGVRDLDVVASPRGSNLPRGTVRAVSTGYIGLGSGANDFNSDLVAVRADTQERFQQRTLAPGVYVNAWRCSRTRATVPLSPRGLPGPSIRFGKHDKCAVRGRVLVRVHAVLESPTSWLPAFGPYVGARKNVLEATLAVRSERTRRPLALVELDRSGETKLWASPGFG